MLYVDSELAAKAARIVARRELRKRAAAIVARRLAVNQVAQVSGQIGQDPDVATRGFMFRPTLTCSVVTPPNVPALAQPLPQPTTVNVGAPVNNILLPEQMVPIHNAFAPRNEFTAHNHFDPHLTIVAAPREYMPPATVVNRIAIPAAQVVNEITVPAANPTPLVIHQGDVHVAGAVVEFSPEITVNAEVREMHVVAEFPAGSIVVPEPVIKEVTVKLEVPPRRRRKVSIKGPAGEYVGVVEDE